MPRVGTVVSFINGAHARVAEDGRFRTVKGVAKGTGLGVRRGPNRRPSGRIPSRAYLLAKLKSDHGYDRAAVHRDMSRSNKKLLNVNNPTHARIARRAGSLRDYDIQGLDNGVPIPRGRSALRMRTRSPTAKRTPRTYPRSNRTPTARSLAASRANVAKARAAKQGRSLGRRMMRSAAPQTGGFWW